LADGVQVDGVSKRCLRDTNEIRLPQWREKRSGGNQEVYAREPVDVSERDKGWSVAGFDQVTGLEVEEGGETWKQYADGCREIVDAVASVGDSPVSWSVWSYVVVLGTDEARQDIVDDARGCERGLRG